MSRQNRGTVSKSITRKRKLTILLGDSAANTPSNTPSQLDQASSEYDVKLLVSVCKQHWAKWTEDVRAGRDHLVEAVSQYPTSAGVEELMEAEDLFSKMFLVSCKFAVHLNSLNHLPNYNDFKMRGEIQAVQTVEELGTVLERHKV